MEFSRPEYWSGSLFLLQRIFPTQGESRSPTLQVDSLPAEPQGKPKNTGVGGLIPSPADLPDSGIELESLALQADSLPVELHGKSFLEVISEMQIKIMSFFQKCDWQTSPVVQWLRICLPMQRTWV